MFFEETHMIRAAAIFKTLFVCVCVCGGWLVQQNAVSLLSVSLNVAASYNLLM